MSRSGLTSCLLVLTVLLLSSLTFGTAPLNASIDAYSLAHHHTRVVRESRMLIGPFDLSKKAKKPKQLYVLPSSAASIQIVSNLTQKKLRTGQNIPTSIPFPVAVLYETSTTYALKRPVVRTRSPHENYLKMYSSTVAPQNKKRTKSRKTPKKRKTKAPSTATAEEPPWPGKRAAVLEGDLVLGGLMMMHGRAAGGGAAGVGCGPLRARGGVQVLEAMLFALQAAGAPAPGVRLGALVLDDCDTDTRGLEMALDFIKGSGAIGNIDDDEHTCNASAAAVRKVILGVVGAASSVTSVQVANLLRLFKIPQVSFFSTSPELSNKARFEYFTRTIPSDSHQVRAMVEIVKKLEWRYVSIIYEESNYGIKAFEELETMLARHNICIAVKERLVKDTDSVGERFYDGLVERLLSRPRARGVIVFGSEREVAGLMGAVRRRGAIDTFEWLGSDGWSGRSTVTAGNERAVEGAISVRPQANPVRGFREYFLNLTVENNPKNPWFVEYWEEQFRCRYPGAPRTPFNARHTRRCSGAERLPADTPLEDRLQFVADAVFAFVHALRDMHRALCGGRPGLCDRMRPVSGPQLLRYLRRVRFTGLSGDEFHFDANGDGPARYNIVHYKQVSRGAYHWLHIGQYLDGVLHLDMNEIQFKLEAPRPPASVCSAECAPGQAKRYAAGDTCCWHCYNCSQYEIRSPRSETACALCPLGTLPDAKRTRCAPLPALYLRPAHPAAAAAMTFSALGALLTMAVGTLWVLHGDTPVVRASGRELSLVLLAGVLTCYLVTFALVLRPTDLVCALQRFGSGLCFTVMYAALLTKTNRIVRIFAAPRRSARRPALISPRSQLVICFLLISVQVAIVAVWQAARPARAIHHHPSRSLHLLVCDSYVDASAAVAFSYPAALVAVCTVHAVLTRNIPEAFNESKHIGFAMYTTCVIWLAFVPLYFGTVNHVPLRVTSMAVTISLSASVTLACLFAPKVYIILVRPERNVRATLRPARWRSGGAAGGAVCAALVGAASLPSATATVSPPARMPSPDYFTLQVTVRSLFTDRQVQTDESSPERNRLQLDPCRLATLAAGLPAFSPACAPHAALGALRRRGLRPYSGCERCGSHSCCSCHGSSNCNIDFCL